MKRLLPILLLSACATAQFSSSALTVSDVWARHHDLDGKMIWVEGVINRCASLGCPLQESTDSDSKALNIGTSRAFDDAVQTLLGKRIVVEGRLRADCLHIRADPPEQIYREDGEPKVVVCTDRASMIMNPRLIAVVR